MTANQKESNIKKLVNNYTIETTPNIYDKFNSLEQYLPHGNDVYITYLPDENPKRIINTAKKLQSIKTLPVYGAIGGFHLFNANDTTISKTANWLKNNGMVKFMGGHCTGIHAATKIAEIIGIERENLSHTAIGSVLTKDLIIIRSSVE